MHFRRGRHEGVEIDEQDEEEGAGPDGACGIQDPFRVTAWLVCGAISKESTTYIGEIMLLRDFEEQCEALFQDSRLSALVS